MTSKVCPNCKANVPAESRFCPNCGHLFPATEVTAPQESAQASATGICSRCGHTHTPPYPTHCQACGYPLSAVAPTVSARTLPDQRPSAPPPTPVLQTARQSPKVSTSPKARRWLLRGLLGLIGLMAIGGLASAAWFWWSNRGSGSSPIPACHPTPPGSDFEAANQRDLQGELQRDSYFKSGTDYLIADNASLTVPHGITLIIEPGARVKFGQGSKLAVAGTLLACGESGRRILFTADTTAGRPGYWSGVEVQGADPQSVVGYATFEFAGKDNSAALSLANSDLQLQDLKFDSNQWYALSLDPDSFPRLRLPFTVDNGPHGWEVRGGVMHKSLIWASEMPFVINGVVEVDAKASLTIPSGESIKFLKGSALRVRGELSAVGTNAQKIVFTSANDAAEPDAPNPKAGDWVGLQFVGQASRANLEFAEVRYAGGDADQKGCLWVSDAAPALRDVTIRDCAAFSLSTDILAAPTLERLSLAETDATRRWELRGSKLDGVVTRTLSKTLLADGATELLPVVTGWLDVTDKASLTLGPGLRLLFQGSDRAGLAVEGKLTSQGTDKEPVVLTSWRDASAGGIGNAVAGDWAGLHLTNSRPDTTSLDHLELRFGGAGGGGCLWMQSASPTIVALSVSDCAAYPISSDLNSQPVISGLQLHGNAHEHQWEFRESTLVERGEVKWAPLTATDGQPLIRVLTSRVTVEAEATLTLQSGAIVKFTQGAGLLVKGTLLAQGTAQQPILLTSWRDPEGGGSDSGAQPGDWLGVALDGTQAAKKLAFVTVRYAGVADQKVSCLWLSSAAPTLSHVSVSDCAYYPISSDLASDPNLDGLTLTNNQPADEWAVRESSLPQGTQRTWTVLPLASGSGQIVRVATGWLTVEPNAQLDLKDGVVVKFIQGTGLAATGTFVAEGTASTPVILTSWRDPQFSSESGVQAGDWIGITMETGQGNSRISHVEVRYAGGERNPRGAIVLVSAAPQFADVLIRDSAWYPLSLDVKATPKLDRIALKQNSPDSAVEVRASALDTAGELAWSPWTDADGHPLLRVVTGLISIAPNATLRLDPNTVVKFDAPGGLEVHGGLLANGAVLTSLWDGDYGSGSGSSGTGQLPWQGVRLYDRQLSRLQNTVIRYADVALWLENATPQIESSRIEDSRTAAINADLASAPEISGLTLDHNPVNGLLLRASSLPDGQTHWTVLGPPDNQLVRVVQGLLTIGPKSQMMIDPGVVIKFGPQSGLVVEGQLHAGQLNGALVSLTSVADDSVGGVTGSSPQTPVRGAWQGVKVNPNNTNAQLSLMGVNIRYAAVGLFLVNLPQWEFNILTISDSQLYGLSCDATTRFTENDPNLALLNNGAETLQCPTPDR